MLCVVSGAGMCKVRIAVRKDNANASAGLKGAHIRDVSCLLALKVLGELWRRRLSRLLMLTWLFSACALGGTGADLASNSAS